MDRILGMKKIILLMYIYTSLCFTIYAVDAFYKINNSINGLLLFILFITIASYDIMNVIECTIQLYKSGKFDEQA